jgi:hypothetical protein
MVSNQLAEQQTAVAFPHSQEVRGKRQEARGAYLSHNTALKDDDSFRLGAYL